jgi:hypothetical protein
MTANTQMMEATQDDGAGVELLENKLTVFDDMGKGVYTKKIFHIDRRFPPWLRAVAPKVSLSCPASCLSQCCSCAKSNRRSR